MKIIKIIFDGIASRFVMVILAVLVLLIGLWSPSRLMYALSTLNTKENKKGCSTC